MRSASSFGVSTPAGGRPSTTPSAPRPSSVSAMMTSTWFAVVQKIVHSSGTCLRGFKTLTGKPSRRNTTNESFRTCRFTRLMSILVHHRRTPTVPGPPTFTALIATDVGDADLDRDRL